MALGQAAQEPSRRLGMKSLDELKFCPFFNPGPKKKQKKTKKINNKKLGKNKIRMKTKKSSIQALPCLALRPCSMGHLRNCHCKIDVKITVAL